MEGLDLLKQEWKKQDASLPKYAQKDLYGMLFKKSSSMVKWIFYISVMEFVFWLGLSIVLMIFDTDNAMNRPEFKIFNIVSNSIFYVVIVYFMVAFYRNYRNIEVNDSVKGLMGNILKTRRTVKHYVWFNLGFFALSWTIVSFILFTNDGFKNGAEVSPMMLAIILGVLLIVILAILLLFYRIVYGILTRRLQKNYKELAKIEV